MGNVRVKLFAACAALLFCLEAPVRAANRPYVAVAFHDVADQRTDADDYTVTTGNLVSFFEWLRGHDWTAITLDDIARAKAGVKPLPERAILITFDDGFRSLYTRVYPLLLAYRIPVLASLMVGTLDATADSELRFQYVAGTGSAVVQRSQFLTWAEAREMKRSGLVEFASHSYDLHHEEIGNPLGSLFPSGASRRWTASEGYETEDALRRRIRADLEKSRLVMRQELGTFPRALVWPFGRYTSVGREEALAASFEFILTLDPEFGAPEDLPVVPRVLPVRNRDLATAISNLMFGDQVQAATRLVRLDPGRLPWQDPAAFEKALGAVLERVRALGVNRVVVDAAVRGASGNLEAAWFPNRALPVRADVLSRIVWQLRTRASATVTVALPVDAARTALGSDAAVEQLYQDLGASVLADAVLLEHAPALAAIRFESSLPEPSRDIRRRRRSMDLSHLPAADALAMRCFFAFDRERPGTQLYLLAESPGATPSAVADLTLVEAPAAAKPFQELVSRLHTAGWLTPPFRDRSGIWIRAEQPPSPATLSTAVRLFQRQGGVAFGWEPDDPLADRPQAAATAPAVSTVAVPRKL